MHFQVETEQEEDGRWIAEVMDLPGALAYGESRDEAVSHSMMLCLRIRADRLEHGESVPGIPALWHLFTTTPSYVRKSDSE